MLSDYFSMGKFFQLWHTTQFLLSLLRKQVHQILETLFYIHEVERFWRKWLFVCFMSNHVVVTSNMKQHHFQGLSIQLFSSNIATLFHTKWHCATILHISKACRLDSVFVFVTLFCTTTERASWGIHKLLRTGEVPTTLTFIVLVVADGLFGLCGPERLGGATHSHSHRTRSYPIPLPPFPRPQY